MNPVGISVFSIGRNSEPWWKYYYIVHQDREPNWKLYRALRHCRKYDEPYVTIYAGIVSNPFVDHE